MSLAISVGCASRCLCVYLNTQQQQTTHTHRHTYTHTHTQQERNVTNRTHPPTTSSCPTPSPHTPPRTPSVHTTIWDLSCQDLTKWNQLPWSKLMDRLHGPHHDDARQLKPSAKVSVANSLWATPPQIWNHSVSVLVFSFSLLFLPRVLQLPLLCSAPLPASLLLLFYCIKISFYYFLNIYLGAQIRNSTFTTGRQAGRQAAAR